MNIQRVRSLGYKGISYVRYTQITKKGLHTVQAENTLKKQNN